MKSAAHHCLVDFRLLERDLVAAHMSFLIVFSLSLSLALDGRMVQGEEPYCAVAVASSSRQKMMAGVPAFLSS